MSDVGTSDECVGGTDAHVGDAGGEVGGVNGAAGVSVKVSDDASNFFRLAGCDFVCFLV